MPNEIQARRMVPVVVTMPEELTGRIQEHISKLDMNRSQYFRKLAREDLLKAAKENDETEVAP